MKKIRNFLLGLDLMLVCILAGAAAEEGMEYFIKNRAKEKENRPVMQINRTEEELSEASTQDLAEKKVALTFDDGPNAIYTEGLLAGLKERGVRATFFLLGKAVEISPQLVEQMHKDGHLIGNHSYEHVNLSSLSDEAAIAQVDKTNEAIHQVTGEYPEYIRPPYGCWKSNLDYDTTMIEVLWNVDPLDWKTDNAPAVVERVLSEVEENDIILLHDASESSVQAAFEIIDKLTAQGYVFVTVDEILFD
jgi:peptidoglycan/xylan/chitin deacetylase (PgdA/CDA1 family)